MGQVNMGTGLSSSVAVGGNELEWASSHRSVHLVLLPGLDGTEVFFRPLLAQLPAGITATIVQFPDEGPYAYAELLARVQQQLTGLPDCYVLAASFSGPLAVMLAAASPHKVRGLILVATFLRSPRPGLSPLRSLIREPLVWALRVLRRLPVWTRPKDNNTRIAKRETWARVSARGLAGRARAVLRADVRELLCSCSLPVLAVAYDTDKVVAQRWSEEIVSCCPSARFVTLPGGHLGMFDEPKQLAAEVVRFIDSDRIAAAAVSTGD